LKGKDEDTSGERQGGRKRHVKEKCKRLGDFFRGSPAQRVKNWGRASSWGGGEKRLEYAQGRGHVPEKERTHRGIGRVRDREETKGGGREEVQKKGVKPMMVGSKKAALERR